MLKSQTSRQNWNMKQSPLLSTKNQKRIVVFFPTHPNTPGWATILFHQRVFQHTVQLTIFPISLAETPSLLEIVLWGVHMEHYLRPWQATIMKTFQQLRINNKGAKDRCIIKEWRLLFGSSVCSLVPQSFCRSTSGKSSSQQHLFCGREKQDYTYWKIWSSLVTMYETLCNIWSNFHTKGLWLGCCRFGYLGFLRSGTYDRILSQDCSKDKWNWRNKL